MEERQGFRCFRSKLLLNLWLLVVRHKVVSSDKHDDSETIIKKVNLDRQIEP